MYRLKKSGISKNWIEREVRKMKDIEVYNKFAFTVEEAATVSGIGHNAIRKHILEHDFPCFKEGAKNVIPAQAFLKWLNDRGMARVGMPVTSSIVDRIRRKREMG